MDRKMWMDRRLRVCTASIVIVALAFAHPFAFDAAQEPDQKAPSRAASVAFAASASVASVASVLGHTRTYQLHKRYGVSSYPDSLPRLRVYV